MQLFHFDQYLAIVYGISDSERQLLRYYPKEVRTFGEIPLAYEQMQKKIRKKNSGFVDWLRRWALVSQRKKFEQNKNKPVYAGARGEKRIIKILSELGDDYHIFCGLHMFLPYTVSFRGQKNLRSAQMDFVIISKKGLFVMEVKNWSDSFAKNYNGFSPHEQTARAGRVLWITMQQAMMNVRVKTVLVSIHDNLQYDEKYTRVFVTSPEKIIQYLDNRKNIIPESDVFAIVDILKRYV